MPDPVVVIPGYYGSVLSDRLTGQLVWIDAWNALQPGDLLDAIRLDTGDPDRIHATAILDEFQILRFWSPDIYKRLIRFLRDDVGYPADHIYAFHLDWRRSMTLAADDLDRRISGFLARTGASKVNLVAHSHGGLVARMYMHRHGSGSVANLITLGTPHKGMLDTFEAVVRGLPLFGWSRSHVRDVARTFPSAYELLPHDARDDLFAWNGAASTPFADSGWLPDPRLSLLLGEALGVVAQLPRAVPVPSAFIYGTRRGTRTRCTSDPSSTRFEQAHDGDGTVPRVSAAGAGLAGPIVTTAVPFGIHSQLFNYDAAQRTIKDTLLGRTRPIQFSVAFASEPAFRPYSTNRIAVELREGDGMPVPGAAVTLTLRGFRPRREIAQTAAGDFYDEQLKMPGPGRHLEYEVVASAPSLPQPLVRRGILFAGNH